ncbi:nuclear transport factor 2 family protein [Streptomyces sp. NRRL S-1824]|uniref:nuclear transport factor 2 family protein n=1 Tax=Streptomyces sp. NRRL S-1824 TaxID=1463889 RepID=UPI0004CBB3F2|nr:nuclear transport factor 2 family protein [Streptomyces sp. NRRL S-1824]
MKGNQPQADVLPGVVTEYLTAHRERDAATAITAFTHDATVTDDGKTYTGAAAIESWLNRSASEYTYTTVLTGVHSIDASHYTAAHRLEGDFPGGVVDLRYQFTLRDGRIQRLVIEP